MNETIDREALAARIAISTLTELKAMCAESNLTVHPRHKEDTLRKMLRDAYGLTQNFSAPQPPKLREKSDPIFPPYNLSVNGIWGGRRYRVRLRRTQETGKKAKAEPFVWNGKHPYWVSYEETACVPEPIYNRLVGCEKHVPVQHTTEEGEVTTIFQTDRKYAFDDHGVDPNTAHLAGSLTEWYQCKGPNWFKQRSFKEIQQICQVVDVPHLDREKKPIKHEDLLPALMVHFFGWPDPEEMTDEVAQAA